MTDTTTKRYDLGTLTECRLDPDGEWVRAADLDAAVAAETARCAGLVMTWRDGPHTPDIDADTGYLLDAIRARTAKAPDAPPLLPGYVKLLNEMGAVDADEIDALRAEVERLTVELAKSQHADNVCHASHEVTRLRLSLAEAEAARSAHYAETCDAREDRDAARRELDAAFAERDAARAEVERYINAAAGAYKRPADRAAVLAESSDAKMLEATLDLYDEVLSLRDARAQVASVGEAET